MPSWDTTLELNLTSNKISIVKRCDTVALMVHESFTSLVPILDGRFHGLDQQAGHLHRPGEPPGSQSYQVQPTMFWALGSGSVS